MENVFGEALHLLCVALVCAMILIMCAIVVLSSFLLVLWAISACESGAQRLREWVSQVRKNLRPTQPVHVLGDDEAQLIPWTLMSGKRKR